MKKIWCLLLMLLLPFNVYALEGGITLECDKKTVSPGDTITCVMKGFVSDDKISNVNFKVKTSNENALTLTEVKKDGGSDYWSGGNDDGHIVLYTDNNKEGTFDLVTFTLKANENIKDGSDVKINIYELSFSGADYLPVNLANVDKDIRVASTINNLSDLKLNIGELSPVFNENTNNYSATVDAEEITIEATAKDSKSQVKGDLGTLKLNYGINNFAVNVTSEAGVTKVYSIIINRPDNRDTDNTLKTLKINGTTIKLEKNKFEYSYDVENNITEADIIATLNSELSVLTEGKLERKIKLSEGKNKIEFKVMAENEKIATYIITINRKTKAGITTNPKTGSGTIWIVIGVLIISIAVGICSYEYYKKKVRKNNEEK